MQFNRTLRTENECVQRREIGEPRETNLGSKVVLKLLELFQKSGRNITSNNFFTNLELGRKLLMQNFTIVATIRKNRKELPAEFVSTKDRKEFTILYGFQKKAMIASYCPKKGMMVTLLRTMHLDKGTESPGMEKKTRSHYLLQRKKRRCRYHGPNGEMVYYQKKNSKIL